MLIAPFMCTGRAGHKGSSKDSYVAAMRDLRNKSGKLPYMYARHAFGF